MIMNQNEFDIELQKCIKKTIEIAWDYIYNSNELDAIYIYTLLGNIKTSEHVFIHNEIPFEKHKISNINSDFIVTDEKQGLLNSETMLEIEKMEELFKEYNREIPYEIKIIYFPKTKKLDVKFNYENPFPNEDSAVCDGFRAWMKDLEINL